jgi:methylamine dehydrogenase accessory protein MauD
MCKKLLPVARSFAQSERGGLDLVLIGDGDRASHEVMVAEHRLQDLPLILSPIVGITLGIGKLPHAVLIDAEGVLRSSGIVNSREHLESLLVAQETGWASMQDYLLGTRQPAANGALGSPDEARRASA